MNTTTCETCSGKGHIKSGIRDFTCPQCGGAGKVLVLVRYCAICGEPEGSYYAKACCSPDQMLED